MSTLAQLLGTTIDASLAATDPDTKALLDDLQANILKGHGRWNTGNMFLSFAGMPPDAIAAVIRLLGARCMSAGTQLRNNIRQPPHTDGGTVRCLFLSASGYRALGNLATMPGDHSFVAGMDAAGPGLADPPRAQWNADGWQGPPADAMLLVADADPAAVDTDLKAIEQWLDGTSVTILVIELGLQQFREFQPGIRQGVEHFGYVDGRSQPLFLKQDVDAESQQNFNATFPPSQFIVADPNGRGPLSAGSYFVFRKLEQNVRGFNAAEDALGKALYGAGASSALLDRAGAMVVGRFEDGTPLTESADALAATPPNDFTYAGDADGARCPFHAHIRKVNPRGDTVRKSNAPPDAERSHIMARRGITYGAERPHLPDFSDFADVDSHTEPAGDCGLLFMAYMASIGGQFEFTQKSWANNPGFVQPGTGIDPIIGLSTIVADHTHTYANPANPPLAPVQHSFEQFVTLQGGGYFFAPSLSFLRTVGLI